MAERLTSSAAGAELVRALAVGWYFGSAAMVALGAVVLLYAFAPPAWDTPGDPPRRTLAARTTLVIGAVYAAFGLGALVYRDFNPHFLVAFVVPGALVVAGSLASRPRPPGPGPSTDAAD